MLDYIYELVELINNYNGSASEENRMRDLICYLSDCEDNNNKELIKAVVFEASEKLRVFGYIHNKSIINTEEYTLDNLYDIKHQAIQNLYTSKVFRNNLLDRRQKEIVDVFQSLKEKRLLVSAPTSFGKTFILRELLFLNQNRYNNILLIFPTIALLNENTDNIKNMIKSLGSSYKIVNNVYSGIVPTEKHIFILTPERALKLLSDNDSLQFDFFFFDEIYKIDEDFNTEEDSPDETKEYKEDNNNRAKAFRVALYLLTKTTPEFYLAGPYLNLKNLKDGMKRYIETNHIFTHQIDFEPTMRIEIDAWRKGCIQKHPVLGESSIDIFDKGNLSTVNKISGIMKYIKDNDLGQTIFYCSTPAKSMEYVQKVIERLPKQDNAEINSDFIEHLKRRYGIKTSDGKNTALYWTLVRALENGYGVHHGKFPKYIQNEILKMFNDGKFYNLFCTSTIIEGVNTNAQNVVIVNNSAGNHTLSAFTLKNIKGRAGRYYHNYVGRVFYTDAKQRQIEKENQIQLNFSTFDSEPILKVDLDNSYEADLSDTNRKVKSERDTTFDYDLLPDSVFVKNRLYARDVQEKYLHHLLKNNVFKVFIPLIGHTGNIKKFLENKMMNKILETIEEVGIIDKYKASVYHAAISKYSMNRTRGVIEHHIKRHIKSQLADKKDPLSNIDSAYINAFAQIRNIVEYEVPKLLCLFEALFSRAASIKDYDTSDFNMSAIIRFYELGVTSEFGLALVEFGFPIDTIKEIETAIPVLSNLSAKEAILFLREKRNSDRVLKIVDNYELSLFKQAIRAIENK